jgi:hypothetical protein
MHNKVHPECVAIDEDVNDDTIVVTEIKQTELTDLPNDLLLTIAKYGDKEDIKNTMEKLTGVSKQFRDIVRECNPINKETVEYGKKIITALNQCKDAAFHSDMIDNESINREHTRLEIDISVKIQDQPLIADMKLIFKSQTQDKWDSGFSRILGISKQINQTIHFSMDLAKTEAETETMKNYWNNVKNIQDYEIYVYNSANDQDEQYKSTYSHVIESTEILELFKFIAKLMSKNTYTSSINLALYGVNGGNQNIVYNIISNERKKHGWKDKIAYFEDLINYPVCKLPQKLEKK